MSREKLISKIQNYLLTRRETLRGYISGELSNLGTDEDYESLDDEAYFVMAATEAKELQQIDAAIERLRSGRFGVCEGCEKPIAEARLKALPCGTLCIDCQRQAESGQRPSATNDETIRINNEFAA